MKTGVEFDVRCRGVGALIAAQAGQRMAFDSLDVVGKKPLEKLD